MGVEIAMFFNLAGLIHSPPVVGSFYLPFGSLEHELTCIMYEMCGSDMYNVSNVWIGKL